MIHYHIWQEQRGKTEIFGRWSSCGKNNSMTLLHILHFHPFSGFHFFSVWGSNLPSPKGLETQGLSGGPAAGERTLKWLKNWYTIVLSSHLCGLGWFRGLWDLSKRTTCSLLALVGISIHKTMARSFSVHRNFTQSNMDPKWINNLWLFVIAMENHHMF